jgi:hypothetical protein
MRPRILDLFCGAGLVADGLMAAGFDVVGVDLAPQPRYPGPFLQHDALALDDRFISMFDAIWASPPCLRDTALNSSARREQRAHGGEEYRHPDLIAPTRALLHRIGKPFVIENVATASLIDPVILCGSHFGLGVTVDDQRCLPRLPRRQGHRGAGDRLPRRARRPAPVAEAARKAIVQWGLAGGCRAYFTAYGLHKTSMQLESAAPGREAARGPGLQVAPLGVRQEFFDDAKLGMELPFIRSRRRSASPARSPGQLRDDPRRQDRPEAVHGRQPGRGGRAAQLRLQDLPGVPAGLRAGAVQVRGDRHAVAEPLQGADPLRRLPRRDGHRPGADPVLPAQQREGQRPHPLPAQGGGVLAVGLHLGVFLQKPSDLGFSDDGYELPELEVRWHEVQAEPRRRRRRQPRPAAS